MRRLTALPLALLVGAGVTVLQVPAREADAASSSSAKTVRWVDQAPRVSEDGVAAVKDKLKDFELTVSQTENLLNQTVEVSWKGGATSGNGTFLALMQCWSDGPDISPTREQCAFGGADTETAEGFGAGRTRQLVPDPRERSYRNDGSLRVVTVGGNAVTDPKTPFGEGASITLGTSSQPACPDATASFVTRLVPPASTGLDPLVVEGPTAGRPGTLTRVEGGFKRVYPVVSRSFTLREVAMAKGLERLPQGVYRTEIACREADGTSELLRFVGYLEATATPGVWRQAVHAGGVSVPFDPLGDSADTRPTDPFERFEVLEYLKPRSTNEISYAKNTPTGGGSVHMEMLTDLEAQHLGCGRVENGSVRSCWLVAAPRWLGEPDGSETNTSTQSSPLSQTNWDRRIEVPLRFAPVAAGCKIGSGLKQVVTHDSAIAVLRSWQPTFCGSSSTASSVLGPLQDFAVRSGLAQPNRMGVVGVPDTDQPTQVVAPLATSAVVVGLSIDRRIPYGWDDYDRDGSRATTMNLTPRLVAKLLTQSYDTGAAPNGGKTTGYNGSKYSGFDPVFTPKRDFPTDNPRTLYDDVEFREINPDLAWAFDSSLLGPQDMGDVLVAASDTDAYQVLWQWVVADPEAKAFLAGEPDAHGMRVNPYYKGQITEATSSFPILDPTCVDSIEAPAADEFPLLCQINLHPRVDDDADAAQAAVRGDTKRMSVAPLEFSGATGYKAEARQQQGRRAMLVVTTSGMAERYGLPTARLRNADGEFVAATLGAMASAREQMPERADGVLLPRPGAVAAGGYPLTTISYAVVDVAAVTKEQREAFATILDYAAGPGQVPGTAVGKLPPGYAPLSPRLTARTANAASLLRDPSSLLPSPEPSVTAAPVPVVDSPDGTIVPDVGLPAGPTGTPEVVPGVLPSVPSAPAGSTPPVSQPIVHASATTGATSDVGWLLPALVALAAGCLIASRVLASSRRTPS